MDKDKSILERFTDTVKDIASTATEAASQALKADERNVRALAILGLKHALYAVTGQSRDRSADIRQAEGLVSRALAGDANNYLASLAQTFLLQAQHRFEEAIVEAERVLLLNPSYIGAYLALCTASILLGEPERAIERADHALRLSPRDPLLYQLFVNKGWAYFVLQQDDQAINWLRRSVAMSSDNPVSHVYLTSALALQGRDDEAHEALASYLSLPQSGPKTVAQWRARQSSNVPRYTAFFARFLEGLLKAGMPEG